MIFDALVGGFIRTNWPRATMSIAAIALGVAIAFALILTKAQLIQSINSDRDLLSQRADFRILPFGGTLAINTLARVRYLDGVSYASPVIERPATVGVDSHGAGGTAARLAGVDLLQPLIGVAGFDEGRPGPFAASGSFIDPSKLIGNYNGAIVSTAMAERLGLHLGLAFNVLIGTTVARFHVAQILPVSVTGVDSSLVFVDITTAQRVLKQDGAVDRIDIMSLEGSRELQGALLTAVNGRARVSIPATEYLSLSPLVTSISATFSALACIGFAVGGLLIHGVIETSILHRRSDIGTLRTIGASRYAIILSFIGEGLVYGAIGGLLGAALAVVSTESVGNLAGTHQPLTDSNIWTIALAVFSGMGVAGISSIPPALSSASISPAQAMRRGNFKSKRSFSGSLVAMLFGGLASCIFGVICAFVPSDGAWSVLAAPICFAAACVLLTYPLWSVLSVILKRATAAAPPPLRLASINLASIPGRIGVALSALSVAVFSSIAFDITVTSFQIALNAWAGSGIAGDIVVSPEGHGGTFDARAIARTRVIPGVRDVVGVRTVRALLGSQPVAVRGEDQSPHRMMGDEASASLMSPLAARLHIKLGDHLELRGATKDVHLVVTAITPDFSNEPEAIVISRSLIVKAFDDGHIDALRVYVSRSASSTAVETELARALAPQRVLTVTVSELRDRFIGVFDATFNFVRILVVIVVVIATLGVASSLSAFVFERRLELRTLRALGAREITTLQMLMIEAFTIAMIASGLGLVMAITFVGLNLYISQPLLLGFAVPLKVPLATTTCILVAVIGSAAFAPLLVIGNTLAFGTSRRYE